MTGWICAEPGGLAERIRTVDRIDPAACRARAERLSDLPGMVAGYERAYRQLAGHLDRGSDLRLLAAAGS